MNIIINPIITVMASISFDIWSLSKYYKVNRDIDTWQDATIQLKVFINLVVHGLYFTNDHKNIACKNMLIITCVVANGDNKLASTDNNIFLDVKTSTYQ